MVVPQFLHDNSPLPALGLLDGRSRGDITGLLSSCEPCATSSSLSSKRSVSVDLLGVCVELE